MDSNSSDTSDVSSVALDEDKLAAVFVRFQGSLDFGDKPQMAYQLSPPVRHPPSPSTLRLSGDYLLYHQAVNAMAWLGLFGESDMTPDDVRLAKQLWLGMAGKDTGQCTFPSFCKVLLNITRGSPPSNAQQTQGKDGEIPPSPSASHRPSSPHRSAAHESVGRTSGDREHSPNSDMHTVHETRGERPHFTPPRRSSSRDSQEREPGRVGGTQGRHHSEHSSPDRPTSSPTPVTYFKYTSDDKYWPLPDTTSSPASPQTPPTGASPYTSYKPHDAYWAHDNPGQPPAASPPPPPPPSPPPRPSAPRASSSPSHADRLPSPPASHPAARYSSPPHTRSEHRDYSQSPPREVDFEAASPLPPRPSHGASVNHPARAEQCDTRTPPTRSTPKRTELDDRRVSVSWADTPSRQGNHHTHPEPNDEHLMQRIVDLRGELENLPKTPRGDRFDEEPAYAADTGAKWFDRTGSRGTYSWEKRKDDQGKCSTEHYPRYEHDESLRKRWSPREQQLLMEVDYLEDKVQRAKARQRQRDQAPWAFEEDMRSAPPKDTRLNRADPHTTAEEFEKAGWNVYRNTERFDSVVPVRVTILLGRTARWRHLERCGAAAVEHFKEALQDDLSAIFQHPPHQILVEEVAAASDSALRVTAHLLTTQGDGAAVYQDSMATLDHSPPQRTKQAAAVFQRETAAVKGPSGLATPCDVDRLKTWVGPPRLREADVPPEITLHMKGSYSRFDARRFIRVLGAELNIPTTAIDLIDIRRGSTVAVLRFLGFPGAADQLVNAGRDSRHPLKWSLGVMHVERSAVRPTHNGSSHSMANEPRHHVPASTRHSPLSYAHTTTTTTTTTTSSDPSRPDSSSDMVPTTTTSTSATTNDGDYRSSPHRKALPVPPRPISPRSDRHPSLTAPRASPTKVSPGSASPSPPPSPGRRIKAAFPIHHTTKQSSLRRSTSPDSPRYPRPPSPGSRRDDESGAMIISSPETDNSPSAKRRPLPLDSDALRGHSSTWNPSHTNHRLSPRRSRSRSRSSSSSSSHAEGGRPSGRDVSSSHKRVSVVGSPTTPADVRWSRSSPTKSPGHLDLDTSRSHPLTSSSSSLSKPTHPHQRGEPYSSPPRHPSPGSPRYNKTSMRPPPSPTGGPPTRKMPSPPRIGRESPHHPEVREPYGGRPPSPHHKGYTKSPPSPQHSPRVKVPASPTASQPEIPKRPGSPRGGAKKMPDNMSSHRTHSQELPVDSRHPGPEKVPPPRGDSPPRRPPLR